MSDEKKIDRLFQEKLKNFEATPSKSVWDNISSELKSTGEEDTGIPIWLRVVGIAAGLLLLFTLSKLMFNQNTITVPKEIIADIVSEKDSLSKTLKDVINRKNVIVEEKVKSENLAGESSKNQPNNSPANSDAVKILSSNNTNKNASVLANIKPKKDNTSHNNKSELILSSSETKNKIKGITNPNLPHEYLQKNNINKEKKEGVLSNINNGDIETAFGAKLDRYGINLNIIKSLEANIIIRDRKLSLIEEIVSNNEEIIEDNIERWKASSSIAPVYFNTFGKGSSIHPQFNNNSKTGNINMSYGISGSYAINKNLSVRAGVNKVNIGYSTNNVIVFNNIGTSKDTQLLRNVDLNEAGQNISFISVEEFNFLQVPSVFSHIVDSSVDQNLGFIEIPFELEYSVSNKKIGISFIGGFSTLFLSDNEIYSIVNGESTLLGKATNLNNTSFSANLGLGFDFKISNKFNLNLEPVFKYQLNTFNNTSGNFNPFIIGVYSGLSYKF